MSRFSFFAALVVVLGLASLAALAAPSQAANQINLSFPISDTLFDPCTGEIVDLNGTARIVGDLTINDNHASLMFHSDAVESGFGQTSGAPYRLLANFSDHIEGSLVNGQFTQTTVIRNERLVAAGGQNNYFAFDDTYHITIDANGDVTVEFDHLTPAGCR
jgi:hypothetical protein